MNNIYTKLAAARKRFHELELTKSGKNKFAGYNYFELGDFLIPAMDCLRQEGLVTLPISFDNSIAVMTVVDMEESSSFTFTSPMSEANLKGCHPIQNLGAVESYLRRYMWTSLMEIVEHDAVDSSEPLNEQAPSQLVTKKKAPVTEAAPKKEPSPRDRKGFELEIEDEEAAAEFTGLMIQTASEMHSDTKENLFSFWKKNEDVIDYLKDTYPLQFNRLKATFSEIKKQLMEQDK